MSRLLKAGRWSGGIRPYQWDKQESQAPHSSIVVVKEGQAGFSPTATGQVAQRQVREVHERATRPEGMRGGGEAVQREEEAYLRGVADGEARMRGEAEALRQRLAGAEAELAAARQQVTELRDALEKGLAEAWQVVVSSLADVAIAVARRVLRRELSMSPEDVVSMVTGLLGEIRPAGSIKILANPGDAVFLEGGMEDLEAALDMHQRLEVIPDPRIEPGGVVIESPEGIWDAGVNTQLGCLKEAIEGVVEGNHEPGQGV